MKIGLDKIAKKEDDMKRSLSFILAGLLVIAIALTSCGQKTTVKQVINTDKAPAAIGPYSQGVRAGNYIFVAGEGPLDPQTGEILGETIQEQTKQTLENIKAILEANGATLRDVVKVTVVLTDLTNFTGMNEVYSTYFTDFFPARTTFGAELVLPDMLVEIDAIAYVGE
jgi:2-iminobutanoate/2-iminopropanoate deaminase